jgi:hypothetical protein
VFITGGVYDLGEIFFIHAINLSVRAQGREVSIVVGYLQFGSLLREAPLVMLDINVM